jgi:hypothetical protein
MQTRRPAAAGALGAAAALSSEAMRERAELYAASRPSLPGQRSAP